MRRLLLLTLAAAALAVGCGRSEQPVTGRKWKIDLVRYLDNSYTATFEQNLRAELRAAGFKPGRDFELRSRSAQGDMASLTMLVDAAVADRADLLITFQAPTLYAAIRRAPDVPKAFTLLQNPFLLGSGRTDTDHLPNLCGVYMVPPVEELIMVIGRTTPAIRTVGTLFQTGSEESELRRDELMEAAKKHGIAVIAEGYESPAEITAAATALLSRKPDAVVHLFDPAQDITFPALMQAADAAKKPVFSTVYNMEKLGACAVCSTDRDAVGRRFAALVVGILRGANPSALPFENDRNLPRIYAYGDRAAVKAGVTLPPHGAAASQGAVR